MIATAIAPTAIEINTGIESQPALDSPAADTEELAAVEPTAMEPVAAGAEERPAGVDPDRSRAAAPLAVLTDFPLRTRKSDLEPPDTRASGSSVTSTSDSVSRLPLPEASEEREAVG